MVEIYSRTLGANVCVAEENDLKSPELYYKIVETVLRQRFAVSYKLLYVNDATGHCAVECEIRDTVSKAFATRVGEVKSNEGGALIARAYEEAFITAAQAVLGLCVAEQKGENNVFGTGAAELPEDEELLFGNMRGKTLREVKDTPQFAHFLENLLVHPDLRFAETTKQNQFMMLLRYAREAV